MPPVSTIAVNDLFVELQMSQLSCLQVSPEGYSKAASTCSDSMPSPALRCARP